LKVRPLAPAPPPLVVGAARRRENNSAVTEKFLAAVRAAK
jgi:hypothetical protein